LALNVLLNVEENPNTSTREIAHHLQVSQQRVQHILKKHIFFPYIPRTVHALFENDPQRRIEFCTYFINKLREYHIFYRCVVCFGQINALSAKIVLLIETTITTGAHKIIMWLWNKISKDDLV
jgi:hypothetical protein